MRLAAASIFCSLQPDSLLSNRMTAFQPPICRYRQPCGRQQRLSFLGFLSPFDLPSVIFACSDGSQDLKLRFEVLRPFYLLPSLKVWSPRGPSLRLHSPALPQPVLRQCLPILCGPCGDRRLHHKQEDGQTCHPVLASASASPRSSVTKLPITSTLSSLPLDSSVNYISLLPQPNYNQELLGPKSPFRVDSRPSLLEPCSQ